MDVCAETLFGHRHHLTWDFSHTITFKFEDYSTM